MMIIAMTTMAMIIIAMIMTEFDHDRDDQDFHSRVWCRRRMLCGGTPEAKKLGKYLVGKHASAKSW